VNANVIWENEIVGSGDTSYLTGSLELLNDNQIFISGEKGILLTGNMEQFVIS